MTQPSITTIEQHILNEERVNPLASGTLTRILYDIALASKIISREVNKAGLVNLLGVTGTTNVQGEVVKKLDIFANDVMIQRLSEPGRVAVIGSEELEDAVVLSENNNVRYVVNMDPLDGSSNIDANVSIGTIFSILEVDPERSGQEQCMQAGSKQIAAGYVIYGSSTMFVYTTRGGNVNGFTLDPSVGEYFCCHPDIRIPERGRIYSANEGNYLKWQEGVKRYLKHIQAIEPADDRPLTSRYIGSLVADFHRNLLYGGIFMYPADHKNPNGKLRLLYEANPLALVVTNAGGLATDGFRPILEIEPEQLHQRVPLFIGSRHNVEQVMEFLTDNIPTQKED